MEAKTELRYISSFCHHHHPTKESKAKLKQQSSKMKKWTSSCKQLLLWICTTLPMITQITFVRFFFFKIEIVAKKGMDTKQLKIRQLEKKVNYLLKLLSGKCVWLCLWVSVCTYGHFVTFWRLSFYIVIVSDEMKVEKRMR